ncbi:hypothetical protein AVEN_105504-1 [Araneus ventricosus]|uniref:Uncharacterized protein n=1 Tax=Araneus ventricosus TaxID=182803 RepID=A0A4Y2GIF2_ARAVE|nr:hypothetical protein AVEN_105504-1 [Araneus ventricosus]
MKSFLYIFDPIHSLDNMNAFSSAKSKIMGKKLKRPPKRSNFQGILRRHLVNHVDIKLGLMLCSPEFLVTLHTIQNVWTEIVAFWTTCDSFRSPEVSRGTTQSREFEGSTSRLGEVEHQQELDEVGSLQYCACTVPKER